MTCDATPEQQADPYKIVEGMEAEEAELMRKLVNMTKQRATQEATSFGWGTERTKAYVQREMIKTRNEAHDRFILEQIKRGVAVSEHARNVHAKRAQGKNAEIAQLAQMLA